MFKHTEIQATGCHNRKASFLDIGYASVLVKYLNTEIIE